MRIGKYSFGLGDRFAHQGEAQLKAIQKALQKNVEIIPVWNKSNREHKTINSGQESVRKEADQAVNSLGWKLPYFVDADHINLSTLAGFIDYSDFFTIDVADYIDGPVSDSDIDNYLSNNSKFIGEILIPGISDPFNITRDFLIQVAEKFLPAIKEASKIYDHIKSIKGENFVPEVSMDEVNDPQSPEELLFILSGLAQYGVMVQTIAPKFTGRFNKGVDYVGDINTFKKEFEQDLLVIDYAISAFSLPDNLKLSVHSGSDKFSIYEPIRHNLQKYNKGIHIKTAGTTWLEEVAGLALSGGQGLDLAKNIYKKALERFEELTAPYSTVIDIKKENLPKIEEISEWDNQQFTEALRHDQLNSRYNSEFRQLLHVGYKVAAEFGDDFITQVTKNKDTIGALVTENLFDKHIQPLFIGK